MNFRICTQIKTVFILLFWVGFSTSGLAQAARSSITVYSVEFGAETIIAIPCNRFMTQFARQIDTTVCRAPDSLRAVAAFLRQIHIGSEGEHMDTRARFVFIDAGGKTAVICMDRWDLCVNGQIIRAYPAFYAYLRSLVPRVHPHMRPEGL